jgi:hypothetical protein
VLDERLAMKSRKKLVKYRSSRMSLSTQNRDEKVRLTIHCTPEQRKYMKMYAAHQDMTLNDFILDCVWEKVATCSHSHTPNAETAAALDATERGEGLIHFDSVEEFIKSLRS